MEPIVQTITITSARSLDPIEGMFKILRANGEIDIIEVAAGQVVPLGHGDIPLQATKIDIFNHSFSVSTGKL